MHRHLRSRRIGIPRGILAIWALTAAFGPTALCQDVNAIPFELTKKDPRVMIGGLVEGGDWTLYSLWLELGGTDQAQGQCSIFQTYRQRSIPTRKKRISIRQGTPKESLVGQGIELSVDRVDKDACLGTVVIPENTPGLWRNLSEPIIETVAFDIDHRGTETPEGAVAPKLIRQVAPNYTPEAIEAGINGSLLLRILIREDGSVDPGNIRLGRPLGYGLDESSIDFLLNFWEFEPGYLNSVAVNVTVSVEISFRQGARTR